VHLYAIREAVRVKFVSEPQAKFTMGISSAKWTRLGLLTNELPLQEGRHTGKHHELLRPATDAEKQEAWGLTDELLESYLAWLEKQVAGSAS
jgi:asparagine synthetase A